MTLPTLKTFLRWPISKRAALFGRWLKTQRRSRETSYWSIETCPLARFGNAITRTRKCWGGGVTFSLPGQSPRQDVEVSGEEEFPRSSVTNQRLLALHGNPTYGQAPPTVRPPTPTPKPSRDPLPPPTPLSTRQPA